MDSERVIGVTLHSKAAYTRGVFSTIVIKNDHRKKLSVLAGCAVMRFPTRTGARGGQPSWKGKEFIFGPH